MLLVARDDGQLDLGLADVHGHALAMVLDGDDVAALGRDELEQLDAARPGWSGMRVRTTR